MNRNEFYRGAVNAGDCVSNGWTLYSQNFGIFLGMSTVAFLTLFFISCIPFLGIFINAALSGPLYVGIYYAMLKRMRGEPIDFGMMFYGFQRFLPSMVVSLVLMLPWIVLQIANLFFNVASIGSTILASGSNRGSVNVADGIVAGMGIAYFLLFFIVILVSVVISVLLFLALPIIADRDDLGPGDVLKLSARAVSGNLGGIIVLIILEALILIGGVLALCIGLLFVLPLLYAANAFAYRQVFPQLDQPGQYAPPQPNEYGSSFGQGQ